MCARKPAHFSPTIVEVQLGEAMSEHENSIQPLTSENGTVHVHAFDLPVSSLLNAHSRAVVKRVAEMIEDFNKTRPPGRWTDPEATLACRTFYERYYAGPLEKFKSLFDVRIESRMIGGVHTEIFTPNEGVPASNAKRILINLHGGAFLVGSRYAGQVESIPIAVLGRVKVISVDYRMAPEHGFPAASDDVVAVYRTLLEEHAPQSIGIYGFSAGGLLTAQTVARLQADGLPLPGAVGMLCGAACHWADGDSGQFTAALVGTRPESLNEVPYFKHAHPNDPLVEPVHFPAVMARFPPSLLMSATRDVSLSSVVHTHSRLVALGVAADLHVWEGLGHGFLYDDADLPQAREGYNVIIRFFERHLGRRPEVL
jgi:epsilon-lactone hydrolase